MSDRSGFRGNSSRFEEARFEPTEAFSWAFALWREEPQRVALPLIVVSFALLLVVTVVPAVISGILGLFAVLTDDTTLSIVLRWFGRLLSSIVTVFVGGYVSAVGYPFVLNVARGRPVQFSDLFTRQAILPRSVVLVFLMSSATTVLTALCVLPGLFFVVATSMALPLLVDQDLDPIAALRASWRLVEPNLAPVFVFCLLSVVAVLAGLLLCFAGAVFVSLPVVFLAQAYVYLRLIGETPGSG